MALLTLKDKTNPVRSSMIMTSWGYILRTRDTFGRRAALIEQACVLAGMALVIPGAWQWMVFERATTSAAFQTQLLTAVSVIIAGLLFVWIANRGLREELHVDRNVRELRVMSVNRLGQTRVKSTVSFDKMDAAFLRAANDGAAELCLRLASVDDVMLGGNNPTLTQIMTKRMTQDYGNSHPSIGDWHQVGARSA